MKIDHCTLFAIIWFGVIPVGALVLFLRNRPRVLLSIAALFIGGMALVFATKKIELVACGKAREQVAANSSVIVISLGGCCDNDAK
jgi:hypothetical protein